MGDLLGWLYPPRCQACRRLVGEVLCPACRAAVPAPPTVRCRRCGQFLDPLGRHEGWCAQCRHESRPRLGAARSATVYDGVARKLIHHLKYHRRRRAATALGEILTDWLESDHEARAAACLDQATALVPVPLHWTRRCWRGFNQAELLAAELGIGLGLPVLRALRRVRATRPQVGLNRGARQANVRGAFAPALAVTAGGTYVLIDDVYTSGATLRECAKVLRRAGAGKVTAVTVARPWEGRSPDTEGGNSASNGEGPPA